VLIQDRTSWSPLAVSSEDPTLIHLKIPVAGHGSSLGIHLTGKTDQDHRDIGLFVKLAVEGGAAAQVSTMEILYYEYSMLAYLCGYPGIYVAPFVASVAVCNAVYSTSYLDSIYG